MALWRAEGRLKESGAYPLRASHLLQGRRRPGLVLDHLREQAQVNRDDLPVLSEVPRGLVNEFALLPGQLLRIGG